MKNKNIIAILLLTIALAQVNTVFAGEHLYSVSSREMGITEFDFSVTEIKREPRISTLIIPGFQDRSAAASRWMMCAYTDLAIKRGFRFWAALYPQDSSNEIQLGFPDSENEDLTKTLGAKFTKESVVVSSVVTYSRMCGM
ncbi:MAG: hypothetical protein PHF56_09025 [Desulfuromonadaceae bacterium]|nr:hypothetical protein [Desulfuromonadaceae bacterium]